MRKFKIHLSRSTKKFNWFSKILQWYQGIPVSHCLVEFETPHLGQNFVYHSVIGNGVSFMSRTKFDKINEIMETYEIELGEEEYVLMRNQLFSECGEHYALMQNIGILVVDLLRRLNIFRKNPWKDGQNCSELLYRYVLPHTGESLEIIEPDLVKPSEIRKILLDQGHKPISSKID